MPTPTNQKLYDQVKAEVVRKNPKHSAYRSAQIVREYKSRGGGYSGKKPTAKKGGNLVAWFKEDWRTEKGKKTYKEGGSIFRPTKRINKDTPSTMQSLSASEKKKAIKEKKSTGRVKKYKK